LITNIWALNAAAPIQEGMRLWPVAILLLCATAFSEEDALTPDAYVAAISAVNIDPEPYGDKQTYRSTLERFVMAKLRRIHSPRDLKTVFYRCLALMRATPEAPQEQLTWMDLNYETLESVMHRLSKIGSDEAAQVMVELYCDKTVGWDAGFSLCGADAIVKCGKAALPYLERNKDREDIKWLIALIRSGAREAL